MLYSLQSHKIYLKHLLFYLDKIIILRKIYPQVSILRINHFFKYFILKLYVIRIGCKLLLEFLHVIHHYSLLSVDGTDLLMVLWVLFTNLEVRYAYAHENALVIFFNNLYFNFCKKNVQKYSFGYLRRCR